MAASLSRPDPSSPASVAEAGFTTARRGFSQDEVRAFLTSVAAELSRLKERERQLEAQLDMAQEELPTTTELDEDTVTKLLGEETLRVLQTARESASQIKIRAEEAAAGIVREANDEANRVRQDAEVETARKRHDAASDAEAEVALAKQQGREMVNEARAYRERVLADLERRTKLARQQIEDLVHGRDRLLQVFERARLVAVDVTSELQSIDGPEEVVNFSPTTGPLPIMVPAGELDRSADIATGHGGSRNPVVPDLADLAVAEADDPAVFDAELSPDEFEGAEEPVADEAEDSGDIDDAADGDTADDDTADDDAADRDTGDGAADGDTADGAADGDAAGSTVDDEADGTDGADDTVPDIPRPAADANVVSLFRDRPEAANQSAADDADDTDESDGDPDRTNSGSAKPDVDDIFERLRGEASASEEPTEEADGIAADEPTAEPTDEPIDGQPGEPTPFTRRDEAIVPLIVAGARKLKRVLADEQNAVLDQLRQNEPAADLDGLVAEADQHVGSYTDALAADLMDAAVAGAAELGVNDTKRLRTSLSKGDALAAAHDLIRDDLVIPLRDRLDRAISDGSGDSEATTKRVRAVYREWKTQHIDDQLDDVFRFAHGGGVRRAAKAGTELIWMVDPAEASCPDCEDNSLAGPVVVGEPYPTGHFSAPAHPGCRCLTVPVQE